MRSGNTPDKEGISLPNPFGGGTYNLHFITARKKGLEDKLAHDYVHYLIGIYA